MTRFVAEQLSTTHWFNMSAAKRDLDYEPWVALPDGLRITVEAATNETTMPKEEAVGE